MAIDTKLIGQAMGGGRPLDLAKAVRPAVIRGERAALMQNKRNAMEAAANQKALKEKEEVNARLVKSIESYDFEKVHPKLLASATMSMHEVRNIARSIINDSNLSEAERSLQIQERVNEPISRMRQRSIQLYKADEEYLDSGDLLSKANSGFVTHFDNIKHDPDGYSIIGDNAVISMDRFDKDNPEDPDFKEMVKNYKQGESIVIPLDELEKMHKPILQDWKGFKETQENLHSAAKNMATKGLTQSQFNSEMENYVGGLKFTKDQARSIAYDQLGKTEADLAGADLNGDGINTEDELNEWLKGQLKQAAQKTYKNWFKPDPADTEKKNDFELMGEEIAENILKDPVSQFKEVSRNTPIQYDKVNKIITLTFGNDDDGNPIEPEKYDLKNASDYMSFIETVITQNIHTSSEKSKMLIAARKWVKERPDLFNTKNNDITPSDILGLPTFN